MSIFHEFFVVFFLFLVLFSSWRRDRAERGSGGRQPGGRSYPARSNFRRREPEPVDYGGLFGWAMPS